jgi:hypothetical protein
MLASMYAQYLLERTDDSIIETDYGFATYRYLNGGKSVYIVDIYVNSGSRFKYGATEMADKICEEAKAKGSKEVLGSVCPAAKNSTDSLKVLLGYGMKLKSASENFIVFSKELL